MKRALVLVLALMLTVPALAHAACTMTGKSDAAHSHAAAAKEQSVSGEVVDMGCYLAHEARGEKHMSCAGKCIAQGMPMGLLTDKGQLYLVTLNHENADPYNQLKDMAGKNVTITGAVMTRNGVKAIEATSAKLLAAK